ncbi:MAG: amino acid adenylation domain-containing protein [Candidatus Aminicenantes bacterium]
MMREDRNVSLKSPAVAAGQKSKEENYWLTRFSGELIKSTFPYDFNQTDGPTPPVGCHPFQLTGNVFSRLMKLINNADVRLYITLAAGWLVLLNKYTGNRDIVLGAPIYKQAQEVKFVNTVLPLRTRVDGQMTFKELLLQVGNVLFQAVAHQNYPMQTLLYHLNLPFSPEQDFPLFDISILLENIHDKKYLQDIRHHISISFLRTRECIKGNVQYSGSRYERQTIARMVRHFMNVLEFVLLNIDIEISWIDILSGEERKQLLVEFNQTGTGSEEEITIVDLFERQAEKTPDHAALISSDRFITYSRLNEKANRLCRGLLAKGITGNHLIGIMASRSLEMVVALWGILKSGCAYLPISPELPLARKKFMIEDSGVKLLLAQASLIHENRNFFPGLSADAIIPIDEPTIYRQGQVKARKSPGNAVYVIYTSGSTDWPKGVMVAQEGLVNYVRWAADFYVKNQRVNFPFYTSISFDLTVTSIFIPLVTGNAMVVYSGDDREFLIRQIIKEHRVEIVKLTPSHLKLVRELMGSSLSNSTPHHQTAIKQFIVGGEQLDTALAHDIHRLFKGNIRIYNEYGPTETVVGSMIYQYDPGRDRGESVPIGTPIHNTRIYLLDRNKKPVPIGATGEIYISGRGTARGYLNRVELTRKKFFHNPFLPGEKMYASGDLARRTPDGQVVFLGRKDGQVKIRGYRVETGEIEKKIKNFKQTNSKVKSAVTADSLTHPLSEPVIRCRRCLLPANYPGIRFNAEGICSICQEYDGYKEHVNRYFKTPEDFITLVKNPARPDSRHRPYDCLLLFSGGKDSSYVLYRLIDMGLQVLTFTFDNGYISSAAFENIKRITSSLKVENIILKAENMNQVFVESLKSDHNVCQGCWHALNTLAAKVAHEHGIEIVISGLSRGQIFDMRLKGLFQAGIFAEDQIEKNLLGFRKTFHSKDNKYSRILQVELAETLVEKIKFVDFYRYFNTPVQQIREYLAAKAWVRPGDTGFCSSNCLINDVGIYAYFQEKGYHFYTAPLSWDIRFGQLSREMGRQEISLQYLQEQLEHVNKILKEIGYYQDVRITDAVVTAKVDEKGNKFLCAYMVSNQRIALPEIRDWLSVELPDYMIPDYFFQVDKIPLTENGKVDKKALLKMEGTPLTANVTYVEPRDKKEKIIAGLCREIFNLDRIGINDNFFTLGANSFGIIQLNNRLKEVFKKDIPVLTLFEYPTIALLAGQLHDQVPDGEEWPEDSTSLAARNRGKERTQKLRQKKNKGVERD